jgi:hypothetical protein
MSLAEKVSKWRKKYWPFVVTGIIAVVGAVVWVEIVEDNGGGSSQTDEFVSLLPPSEFLYLDGNRILTYLSELEGGERGPVLKIAKEVKELKGEVGVEGVTVGATSQHETSAESTLVRTEAASLGLLLHALKVDTKEGVRYESVHLNEPGSLKQLKEGEIVRFVTHWLTSPGYIRPYVVVHSAATFGALFPRRPGDPASAEQAEKQGELAKAFAHQVGPDPRITFAVIPPQQAEGPPMIMLPLDFRGLTSERTLLEKNRDGYTGGRVVVYGKVARVFREEHTPCREGIVCGVYTDFATREVWKNPLEQASNYLIEHVSHNCTMQATQGTNGRDCFLAELEHQTELSAPGAVIVPIAILK